MNKLLIKQLADQAHKNVRSDEEMNGVCFKDYNSEFQKAFAELIVRESARVASDYDGAHYVGTAIEKHFGVTE